MLRTRLIALVLLMIGLAVGYFDYTSNDTKPFALGLDLSGGSYLVYSADLTEVPHEEVKDRMDALQDVITRRIGSAELSGVLGVLEPSVQTETAQFADEHGHKEQRLVVELPGVTDLGEATEMIGRTPLLEFKTENPEAPDPTNIEITEDDIDEDGNLIMPEIDFSAGYIDTELTGRYLKRARLEFSQGIQGGGGLGGEPIIALTFDKTGAELFEQITEENIGKTVAIFLDGQIISAPVVQQAISGGEAVITGSFTPDEAKQLVGRLNSGALPIPIELVSTQTIGPSLGADAVNAGIEAGVIGFVLVGLFLILWYRIPGILAVIALGMYAVVMLALFKLIPVTLTASGIAGFIISLGIAVDANILIFERMKEELLAGQSIYDAIKVGFERAWASIRDANVSSLISAGILFWFGTSLVKGFALTFGLGILISMLTAITVTKLFLFAAAGRKTTATKKMLMQSGFHK